MPAPLRGALRSLILLAFGVWVGALACAAFVVFPHFFQDGVLASREQAGRLVGAILYRLNFLEFGCALAILVGTALVFARSGRWALDLARVALPLVMFLALCGYALVLGPRLSGLRGEPRGERFRCYHRLYTGLVGLNLVLGVAGLALYAGEPAARRSALDSPRRQG